MTTAYPLAWPEGWPRTPARERKSPGNLKAPVLASAKRLQTVVKLLGSSMLVVSSNVEPRNDLMPRSDQAYSETLPDPGVAVYFSMRGRAMVIAQDRFRSVAANLQSLALALEYMRGVERHGGAHMMERSFGGFAALPPPSGVAAPEVSWREVFAPLPEGLTNADLLLIVEARYRTKARSAHADAGGGAGDRGVEADHLLVAASRSPCPP